MTGRHLRVARIITRLNIGGPSIQAIGLSRDLRAHQFDTRLLHGRLGAGEGDMTRLLPIDDLDSVYIDDLVRPIAPFSDLRAWWRIYRVLRRWQPDIVHTHMAKAGTLGRLAALAYNRTRPAGHRARLVHTYHGHVFEGYFGSPSTRLFVETERWIARRTDALIAISPQIAHDLVHAYRIASTAQLTVIPLGFNLDHLLAISADDRDPARAVLGISDDAIVVSTVGRLTAVKQHTLLLDVAARVAKASPRCLFLIVGDGELRPALEVRARELELADRVRFLGWRGDLATVYAASDLFALTSRNEGTPVALIEAMAAGLASVSTDVGGLRDVVTGPELGVLVRFGDVEALSAALIALADAPARRAEMGRAARAAVRDRFDATRLVSDIRRLYWQLVGAAAPAVDPSPR